MLSTGLRTFEFDRFHAKERAHAPPLDEEQRAELEADVETAETQLWSPKLKQFSYGRFAAPYTTCVESPGDP
jgi:hypothetical protein